MNNKPFINHYLLFIGAMTLVHLVHLLAITFLVIPKPEAYDHWPLWWWLVILMPIYLIPVVFGIGVKSWQQLVLYALTSILIWQLSNYAVSRVWMRAFPVPYINLDPWILVKLREIIIPGGLVCVGMLLGWLKQRSRLP